MENVRAGSKRGGRRRRCTQTQTPTALFDKLFRADVTEDPYKKQFGAVVKDGETFTVRAMAFSGNAQHLA